MERSPVRRPDPARSADARRAGVIACIDRSEHQTSVCDHAAWFAARTGAAIELLHVREGGAEAGSDAALAVLDDAAARLSDNGAERLALCAADGDFPQVAAQLSAGAEMLVVGRRGEGAARRVGAHVLELLRSASCAVCIVPKLFLPISRATVIADADQPERGFGDRIAASAWLDGLAVSVCPPRAIPLDHDAPRLDHSSDLLVLPRTVLRAADQTGAFPSLARALLRSRWPIVVC